MASLNQVLEQDRDKVFLDQYGFAETIEVKIYGGSWVERIAVVSRGGPMVEVVDGEERWTWWVDVDIARNADDGILAWTDQLLVRVDGKQFCFARGVDSNADFGTHVGRFERIETDVEKSGPGYRG